MPIPAAVWVARMLSAATAVKNTKIFRKVRSKVGIDLKTGEEAAMAAAKVAIVTAIVADPQKYVSLAAAGVGPLVEELSRLVTGLNIPTGTVSGAVSGASSDESRVSLGGIFSRLLDETLQLPTVKEGFLQRAPGWGERTNMERMVGAAFRMQLGDMLADWAGKKVPLGVGGAFSKIAERIDKAINLDDAIEEIIQVPMQAVITRGMEAHYNRQLKPVDLTASEARQAKILGKITDDAYTKILDNMGYRDDTRDFLLEQTYANLTESDVNDAYQWNLLDRGQVKEHYKNKLFNEQDQEIKTKLVEMTRRQKLREKIFELYGNLYRDGVATREEVRPFLQNYGYDNDEIDMWFSVQELERRQRKWISDAKLLDLVIAGTFSIADATNYLVLQGMTVQDASQFLTLAVNEMLEAEAKRLAAEAKAAIKKLPKAVQDKCDDLFSPERILSELLTRAIALIPLGGGSLGGLADLRKLIECALKNLGVTPPATTP